MKSDTLLSDLRSLLACLADPDAAEFQVWHLIVREKALRVRDALVRRYPLTEAERNVDEVRAMAAVLYPVPHDSDNFLGTEASWLGHITPLTAIRSGRKAEVLAYLTEAMRQRR